MDRSKASQLLRSRLDEFGYNDWKIKYVTSTSFLALCSYKDKSIYLAQHFVDINPENAIKDVINHEVAHVMCEGHGHNDTWKSKAIELGATPNPCPDYGMPDHIIDAIRSGSTIDVTFEEEVKVIPKYNIKRIQDLCPDCNAVAIAIKSWEVNDDQFTFLKCGHLIKKKIPKNTPFHLMVSNDSFELVKSCSHVFNSDNKVSNIAKNQCIKCKEFKPYQFQIDGMLEIEKSLALQRGVGCFDEQGLGKTVQALGIFKYRPDLGPFLFITKGSLTHQVYNEIIRWLGLKYIPQIITTGKDGIMPGLKAYICSYDLLRRFDRTKWIKANIKTIILDECQHIKNPDSTRTTEVRELVKSVEHIIALSGTPWKNRGSELFVALNMIDPQRFQSYKQFVNNWVDYYTSGDTYKEGGIRNIKQFKEYAKGCFIRRERTEVLPELPLISRNKFYTTLDNDEKKAYEDEVSEFVKLYNQAILNGEEDSFANSGEAIAKLQRMRHIVGLAKIKATLEFVEEFINETDRKIAVFVHHKDVGQIMMNQIRRIVKCPVMQLVSSMNSDERFNVQKRFNETSQCVLIASTLASGEGLNLQSGSDCVMHERQWNPANEEQTESRFIRIGQKATSVTATYVIAENASVDARLDAIIEMKRSQFHAVMNNSETPKWNESALMGDLIKGIVSDFNASRRK